MVNHPRPRPAQSRDAVFTSSPHGAPQSVRRLGVFLFWDPDEVVAAYVKASLAAFRPFFEKLVVVVNGQVDLAGQNALADAADEVWYRENVDYDVGGYKYAVERLGFEYIAEFDELVLLNYTFYAPVNDIGKTFERMRASGVDFWGLTDFRDSKQNFVQSYFIAIGSRLLKSQDFAQYWKNMPPIVSINDSIEHHEKAFTEYFSRKGFIWEVAFPVQEGEFGNVTIASPIEQMSDGCPTVKYRAFTFPLESLRHREAPYPARTLDYIHRHTDYDSSLIVDHLVQTIPPSLFASNLQTISVAGSARCHNTVPLSRIGIFLNVSDLSVLEKMRSCLDQLILRSPVTIFVQTSSVGVKEAAAGLFSTDITVRIGDPISNVAALFRWSDEVDFSRFDLVLSIGDFTGARRVNAWLDSRAAFYLGNLIADDGVLDMVAERFRDPAIDMIMSPASPYLEGLEDVFWQKNRVEARTLAKALNVAESIADEPSNLHAPHGLFWMRGSAVFDLASAFKAASDGKTHDCGELFNRFLPALLAKRGKVPWRLVSSGNAAQSLAALGWIIPRSAVDEVGKRRELERSLAALQLQNEDLQVRLKATSVKLSQSKASLSQATASNKDLEASLESGRLAMAENRDLRRIHNKMVEDLAELRRKNRLLPKRKGILIRAGGVVKRTWKRMLERVRSQTAGSS